MGRELILLDDKPGLAATISGLFRKWTLDYAIIANESVLKPAEDSEQAVEDFIHRIVEFVRQQESRSVEAILLDVLFEHGDGGPETEEPLGYRIGRNLRSTFPTIPIILFTVRGAEQALREARDFVFDSYISKAEFATWRDSTDFEARLHQARRVREEHLRQETGEATSGTYARNASVPTDPRPGHDMRPRAFIGSSAEALDYAYATQEELEHNLESTVWTQDVFQATRSSLESLLEALDEFDFAIFIFSPDDISKIRNTEYLTVRDNVIFELGLFLGRLNRDRCFFLTPRNVSDLHLPTDLLGIKPLSFDSNRTDDRKRAALGPACNQIRKAIERHGIRTK